MKKHKAQFFITSLTFAILMVFSNQWVMAQGESDHEHNESKGVHLAFQCAVCSNHLGLIEPNDEIKGGFALSAHKHSLVEVEGLYQCSACKTPIFKSKNKLDIPSDDTTLYFSRPISNNAITIAPYDIANLGDLKEHCPVCANKFANSKYEVEMGNFGSKISFKNLKGLFKN